MKKKIEEPLNEEMTTFLKRLKEADPHIEERVKKGTGDSLENLTKKVLKYKKEILSSKEWKKRQKEAEKKENSNKGFVRLLKHLEKNWRDEFREDALWNEFVAWDHDLKNMERQGVLHMTEIADGKGNAHKYYKIGLGGFQYLYLRRINRWVIIASIFAILSFIMIAIQFLLSFY